MEKQKKGRGRPKGSTKNPDKLPQSIALFEHGQAMINLTEVEIQKIKFPVKATYLGWGQAMIYSIENVGLKTAVIDATWINGAYHNGKMTVNLLDIEILK